MGRTIKANDNCNGCGLCEKICSCGNIVINNNKPQFNFKCNFCMACLYDCPNKALCTNIFKIVLLKNGYNIRDFIDNNIDNENISYNDIITLTKSIYWRGLRSYLLESNRRV